MKRKFFLKNLAVFILPLILSTLVLGLFSITLAIRAQNKDIQNQIDTQLNAIQDLMVANLTDIDTLSALFDTNLATNRIVLGLLREAQLSGMDALQQMALFRTNLNAFSYPKKHILSAYVYFDNPLGYFMSTTNGLSTIKNFYDQAWYEAYQQNRTPMVKMWNEKREIQQFSFQQPYRVITLYKTLMAVSSTMPEGCVVVNLRADYYENFLTGMKLFDGQTFYIFDNSEALMLSTQPDEAVTLQTLLADKRELVTIQTDHLGWKYVSVVPHAQVNHLSGALLFQLIVFIVILLLFGVVFSWYYTQKSYRSMEHIFATLNSAQEGRPLPSMPSSNHDVYEYIIQNVLKMFIEENALKMQLSERKYRMKVLEMAALQSQINPHFLYNTLGTIYWKSIRLLNGPGELSSMVQNLSSILRYSLSDSGQTVSLQEELRITHCYCDIQRERFAHLHIVWDCDEALLVSDIQVMKLLFQPLLENAIQHGVHNKPDGVIQVRIRQYAQKLHILIADNGEGIASDKLRMLRSTLLENNPTQKHIGLSNIAKRIHLLYGRGARFHMFSKQQHGTLFGIGLPLHRLQEQSTDPTP